MDRCTYTEFVDDRERRCVKTKHDDSRNHLLATIWTLLDTEGLLENGTDEYHADLLSQINAYVAEEAN